jgi:hypothetical protein
MKKNFLSMVLAASVILGVVIPSSNASASELGTLSKQGVTVSIVDGEAIITLDENSNLNKAEAIDVARELGDEIVKNDSIKNGSISTREWTKPMNAEDVKKVADGWVESNFFSNLTYTMTKCTVKGSTTALAYVPSKGNPRNPSKKDEWTFTGVGISSITADKTGISVTGGSTSKTLTKQYGANDIQDGYSLSYWTVDAYGTTSVLSLMQRSSATFYYGNIDYSTSASNKVYL